MNPLKINIVSLNSQYIHSSIAPWYLKSGIEAYCDVPNFTTVTEDTINNNLNNCFKNVTSVNANIYAFCCYIWNIEYTLLLTSKIKQAFPNAIIVLGGPEVSYNAEEVLKNNCIDYVVSGEGEKPFALLINAIAKNKNKQIPGICYKNGEEFYISEPYISNKQPPNFCTEEYLNSLNGRISYIETSRGCPYSCAFCLSGKCGKVVFFDLEQAKQNIIKLSNSNTKTIKFVDRTFNANKTRSKEIFKFIIENYGKSIPNDKCFHFEIAGDILDNETIEILSTAPVGSIQLEIGMQSFNEETLSYINRKTNTEKLIENIKKLTSNGNIHIHIDLIAGLPKEDYNSFKNSFNIGFSLNANMLQLGFLKILHGSPMSENFEKYGCEYSKEPPYEVISTPYISKNELKELKYVESALDRLHNSGRFKRSLNYLWECGILPFDLFLNFSKQIKNGSLPLDLYLTEFYNFCCTLNGIDKYKLRDLLLLDRIATNSSGVIPEVLKVKDKDLKKAKEYLNKVLNNPSKKGVKRTVVKLYSLNCFAFTDYLNKQKITNEYKINYFNLND